MDHEAFVPFPVQTVRRALGRPDQVAPCVPGLQRDADPHTPGDALAGRLRLRVGGSTITYRGSARIAARGDGGFDVEGEGSEVRGGGTVKLVLRIALRPDGDGTRLCCTGTLQAGGRLAEADPAGVQAAGRRLLDRFAAELAAGLAAESAGEEPGEAESAEPAEEPTEAESAESAEEPTGAESAESAEEPAAAESAEPGTLDGAEELDPMDVEIPETVAGLYADPGGDLDDLDDLDGDPDLDGEPAEAAHARRTMIGRSAEEVDHAPPRGRYAPVAPAEDGSTAAVLRWAAPAAAALVASAVVLRALRRRR